MTLEAGGREEAAGDGGGRKGRVGDLWVGGLSCCQETCKRERKRCKEEGFRAVHGRILTRGDEFPMNGK